MSDNDQSIRVNIRTGTSTRRLESKEEEKHNIYISFEIEYDNNLYRNNLYNLLNASLYDDELNRNPNIRLDVKSRLCKTDDLNSECSICQTKFLGGEKLCTLTCTHTFHYKCLKRWGEYKQDCPLCRIPIPILER